jgi:hypothetical protein
VALTFRESGCVSPASPVTTAVMHFSFKNRKRRSSSARIKHMSVTKFFDSGRDFFERNERAGFLA